MSGISATPDSYVTSFLADATLSGALHTGLGGRLTALLGPETNPEDAMKVIGDLIKGSQVKSAPAPGAGGEEAGVPKVGAAGAGYAAARAIELAQSLLASPVPDASSDAVDPLSALFGKVVAELEAGTPPIPPPDLAEAYRLRMKYRVWKKDAGAAEASGDPYPDWTSYLADLERVKAIVSSEEVKDYCMKALEANWTAFNQKSERALELKKLARLTIDFTQVMKVDTHIHHGAAFSKPEILAFVQEMTRYFGADLVLKGEGGKMLSIKEVFEKHGIPIHGLSSENIQTQAYSDTHNDFSRFNERFALFGHKDFKTIFTKWDYAPTQGRYMAALTLRFHERLVASNQAAELRISINGESNGEWVKLAAWLEGKGLLNLSNIQWMIQVPKRYKDLRAAGSVKSFGELLDNVFAPLKTVSRDSGSPEDALLLRFLDSVSGFDIVDDEKDVEVDPGWETVPPDEWVSEKSPPYKYWLYHFAARIAEVNATRFSSVGGWDSQFSFRPHSGETGAWDHMIASYLTADGINHGITMWPAGAKDGSPLQPGLAFLYYLHQLGIATSPISNRSLFMDADVPHPLKFYFRFGLNVSVSTDDPLILHLTADPLGEEYNYALHAKYLVDLDRYEVALNSIEQSNFSQATKAGWTTSACGFDVPLLREMLANRTMRRIWIRTFHMNKLGLE